MKFKLCIFTMVSLFSSSVLAEKLRTLNVKNWLSYHTISRSKNHTVAISQDGSIDFFFMKRDQRINLNWPVDLAIQIERRGRTKNGNKGRWMRKKVRKSGFIKPPKAGENPESLTLEGVVTGEVKFKLHFTFSKVGVTLTADFVGKPKDADTADYRLSIVSDIDSMVTISKNRSNDVKKIKARTRGNELRLTSREGKRGERIRFHEAIDSEKLKADGVTAVELRAEKIGRKKLFWSLANPKAGKLAIMAKAENGMPYKGFFVTTLLVDASGKKHSEGLTLEYK